ncbi:hypothetical protein [Streptomyces scabiei]|uniref:hypothetical protein n=1 Tax=Streptomyces scabiei TaxID=1930 RepID=UPI001B3336E4|nr:MULTISPECIES: hypothetical protein [Streptomyces]MBP5890655.1 hypothetical protein [Streptomyces sp. LBUM 1481]MBP5920786.1 hypothetical protein [Streptomyces sp. LBUM 1483]MDX2538892.1 hypothetical protein [Streptomyces scabiei]MDX2801869.1 hypothetical protein [Streptomyces scabiei]MDX3295044.1 hypothetical protein [Streptomyces scabiei]
MQNNLFVSVMRTLVPYGVGLVLTATGWLGIPVDSEAAAGAVSLGLAAAYYMVFRLLEEVAERMAWAPLQTLAGILLGWARPPQYVAPITAPVRMKLDKAAMNEDISEFVRKLGAAAENRGPR